MIIDKIINNTDKIPNERIIKTSSFIPLDDKLNINDPVFLYNDGNTWKIVSLETITKCPIIHDTYYSNKNETFNISIVICPYTLMSMVLFDKYYLTDKLYQTSIVIKNDNNYYIPILKETYDNEFNKIDKLIRKDEVRMMTLKNAMMEFPDCLFLNDTCDLKPLVEKDYYNTKDIIYPIDNISDKFHPKSLVYIIEYKSTKKEKLECTIIIPKGTYKDKINSYDIEKNGFDKYFSKMIEKIREKSGLIYPILWFSVNIQTENCKTVEL